MAERIESVTITVPSGTAATAPQVTALSLRDAVMERIEIRVPPGPSGLVGFAFLHSGQQVIPFTDGQWIVTDNEALNWDVERYPTGDAWAVQAYNVDVFDHTVYLRLHLRELPLPAPQPQRPVAVVAVGDAQAEGGAA